MRSLDLSPYSVRWTNADGSAAMIPYNVRTSIEGILLATGPATTQRLTMSQLLKSAQIAQRILDHENDELLIEEGDYQVILKAFEAFRGFGRQEVELCKRIQSAPTVEVEKVKKLKNRERREAEKETEAEK